MTEGLASRLQHTNVRPEATREDVERLLSECLEHGFDGAMVNPIWVPLAADVLRGSSVHVCTALDFPMGGGTTGSVAAAAGEVRGLGADQIDVMTRPGWLRSGMEAEYREHLAAVVAAAEGAPVKAMLEAALLTDDELARAVELCVEAGVAWIKNSSGFGGGDATPALVGRLYSLAAGRVRVKASGGIRSGERARALLDAGAELLGSSASVSILAGLGPAEPGAY
ncbi:MAG TPA: deoxyribose-phosphate aldolase [Actinomycetota bacterium]|nr:deoxyribose-phosphate aldolase [Actinomycetota bacterium]